MFASDENISSLRDLIDEVKSYISMRYELVRLDFVSKLTILIAAFFISIILLTLMGVVLLFLSYSIAKSLASTFQNEALAFFIVSAFYLLLAIAIYVFRRPLIVRPIANFLGRLFLEPTNKEEEVNK